MSNQIPSDWRIVKVDQTAFCEDWARARQIQAMGVYYLVDASLHVYICSLVPALEAWPMIGFADFVSPEASEKDQGESEMEILASEDACTYYGTDILARSNRPASDYADIPEQEEGETDMNYRIRVADEIREQLCANPCGF